ncbi:DUF4124 domain-containing protein [Thauera sinica]|uniref:DUF4124 domain-containing protein n=1 Tax=Thauera sinica TaxID=2665146 RepID=A0ABW1AUK6_9RHOO|nr:DUF4124 domain-containing protein [Thauera sp. K11]ATE58575.1 hypothetical protein CCZ27_00075 [Thauera sp. K11]
MRQLRPLTLILALCAAPLAQAEIYKCVDAEGRTTYTNDRSAARGCKAIQQDLPVTSVPGPARAPGSGASSGPSPSTFPRVSPNDQRARDDTRRQVLEKELATEEAGLAEAQKQLAEQEAVRMGDERNYQRVLDRLQPYKDKVELHKRNVEALQREIANLR